MMRCTCSRRAKNLRVGWTSELCMSFCCVYMYINTSCVEQTRQQIMPFQASAGPHQYNVCLVALRWPRLIHVHVCGHVVIQCTYTICTCIYTCNADVHVHVHVHLYYVHVQCTVTCTYTCTCTHCSLQFCCSVQSC